MVNRFGVLIDSSYILPALGIEVRGVSNKDLGELDRLYRSGKVSFHYTSVIWIEIIPKIVREYSKIGLFNPIQRINDVILILQNTFKHIEPGRQALIEATRLRQLGHRDMIDNILYGVAVENNLYLLTMDSTFKEFLKTHNLKHEILLTHKQLFTLTKS